MSDESQTTSPLAKSTVIMATGTGLSRITGFLRLAATAAVLGSRTSMADSYTLANNTPNIIYDLVVGGILSATLVPLFVSLTNKEKADNDGESAIMGLVAVSLTVVSVLLFLFAPFLIRLYTIGNH